MTQQTYRVEVESLARAEAGQLQAPLFGFGIVDNAVEAASAILEPPTRSRTENREGDDGA